MTRFVSGKVKNAKNAAATLVMTEDSYFHSVSQKKVYADLEVEEYEIVATLDLKTSEVCQEMDGKHLPLKDFAAGSTAPPFHPRCRSVTAPYFDDDFAVGERAARDGDGNTYYVPGDMSYKEWKRSFVDGGKTLLNPTQVSVEKSVEEKIQKKLLNARLYEQSDYRSVYEEYLRKATPGEGTKRVEPGREMKNSEEEHLNLIHKEFGGDISAPKESAAPGRKTPDFVWNGTGWEDKQPAAYTKNAIDQNVRNGIKQIRENPGGIILDVGESDMPIKVIHETVLKRLRRSAEFDCDVILVKSGEIVDIVRYKK